MKQHCEEPKKKESTFFIKRTVLDGETKAASVH